MELLKLSIQIPKDDTEFSLINSITHLSRCERLMIGSTVGAWNVIADSFGNLGFERSLPADYKVEETATGSIVEIFMYLNRFLAVTLKASDCAPLAEVNFQQNDEENTPDFDTPLEKTLAALAAENCLDLHFTALAYLHSAH